MNEVRNGGDAWCWVAFHPTQIKSAIGNRGTWSKTDPDIANEFQESEARDEHGRWTTEGKDFTSEEGYQFHESKEMQDWVKTIPREESQAVVDYAGLSSNEVNEYLRGTLNPPPINEFVREATPEEQASFGRRWNPQYKTPIFASDPTDYDPADPNNKVADGRIVHNVFYHTDDGKKVEWSIKRVAPDTARIQRAADKAQLINDAIGKHGFVVKEPMEVGRAAYIPGMTEDDLKANVGKIFVEKGFTSTMVGNAEGRLDGYVAIGKTESIYRRYGKIKEFEDEPGVAMKMQITVPLGTKVASVESLRRSEWKFPYKNTTDEKSPDYYARDYTKGTVHLDALGDKKTRSESELLLGSGAHFRIDSVKPGGSVSTGDPTLKPVKYVNVHLTYVGGGASDPQQESANEFNPDQPRDDHGRFAPLGDMPDKDIEKTMPDYYRALSKYTDDPMSKEAHDWVKERMKASGTDVDALGHSKLGHVERVADSFHDPFHRTVGYLHDAVEDTDITLDQIKEKFGDRVAKAVEVETWKKGSGEKYDDYINRLTHNRDAIKVKLADMSDNLSHMPADVSDNPKLMEKKAAYERLVPKLELMAKPQRLTNLTPAIREKLGQLDEHYQPFNPLGSNTMARYYDHEEGWTAPRAQLHDIIVDKMRGGVPKASGQPEFTLMGGGTAAGKSTVTKSGLLTLPEHVHIDSDEIKKSLPENNVLTHGGDNRGANYVHEESSYLAKRTMRESFAAGQNVALDGTGDSKVESVEAKADEARAQGYKVRGEYVTCSVDKAIDRAAQRAAKTGRMVPVQTLRVTHKSVSQIFPELVKRGTFDEAHLWDTDGDKPVLVATAKGKDLTVHEPKLWDKFLAKANE